MTDLASAQSAHNRISKLGRDAVKDLHKVGREQANAFQQTIRRGISKLLDKALLAKKLTIEQKIRIADTRVRLMKDAINGFDAATKKVPETMGRIRARLWKDFRKQNIAFLSAEGVRRLLTNVRRGWAYQRRGTHRRTTSRCNVQPSEKNHQINEELYWIRQHTGTSGAEDPRLRVIEQCPEGVATATSSTP